MERVVRRINGVSPEDVDLSSVSGLRSKNRTRFLDLLGVARGVNMLLYPDFEARGLIRERRFRLLLVLLFLLTTTSRLSSVMVG